jgi:uncharacterized protein (DUF2252 family)
MKTSNVAERILEFNQGRDPDLLQLKYRAMRADVFAFFRGTCHLFYQGWPTKTPLDETPPVWICGDLHLQNLGSYKGDNRLVYFNINDFDESALAPCTWDLARFLTCLLVSAPILKIKSAKAVKLCSYFLDVYARTLTKCQVRPLDQANAVGLAKTLLFQTLKRPRKEFLDARTELVGHHRKLRIDHTHTTAITEAERAEISALMERWRTEQPDPQFFKVLDAAHRIAGIGSLGVERYILLVEGKSSPDQNYLLDLKAETNSSLQPYLRLRQPQWVNQAERAATTQRWVQGIPPALLAAVELGGNAYVLRELQPIEDKVNLQPLYGNFRELEQLVKIIAKVVAWGQLRSGGHQGSAPAYDLEAFAQAPRWREALLSYAQSYAGTVEQDYRSFCSAYDAGDFSLSSPLVSR